MVCRLPGQVEYLYIPICMYIVAFYIFCCVCNLFIIDFSACVQKSERPRCFVFFFFIACSLTYRTWPITCFPHELLSKIENLQQRKFAWKILQKTHFMGRLYYWKDEILISKLSIAVHRRFSLTCSYEHV